MKLSVLFLCIILSSLSYAKDTIKVNCDPETPSSEANKKAGARQDQYTLALQERLGSEYNKPVTASFSPNLTMRVEKKTQRKFVENYRSCMGLTESDLKVGELRSCNDDFSSRFKSKGSWSCTNSDAAKIEKDCELVAEKKGSPVDYQHILYVCMNVGFQSAADSCDQLLNDPIKRCGKFVDQGSDANFGKCRKEAYYSFMRSFGIPDELVENPNIKRFNQEFTKLRKGVCSAYEEIQNFRNQQLKWEQKANEVASTAAKLADQRPLIVPQGMECKEGVTTICIDNSGVAQPDPAIRKILREQFGVNVTGGEKGFKFPPIVTPSPPPKINLLARPKPATVEKIYKKYGGQQAFDVKSVAALAAAGAGNQAQGTQAAGETQSFQPFSHSDAIASENSSAQQIGTTGRRVPQKSLGWGGSLDSFSVNSPSLGNFAIEQQTPTSNHQGKDETYPFESIENDPLESPRAPANAGAETFATLPGTASKSSGKSINATGTTAKESDKRQDSRSRYLSKSGGKRISSSKSVSDKLKALRSFSKKNRQGTKGAIMAPGMAVQKAMAIAAMKNMIHPDGVTSANGPDLFKKVTNRYLMYIGNKQLLE